MAESARPATATIRTSGCQLNIADSETMGRHLPKGVWLVLDQTPGAEAVISPSQFRAGRRHSFLTENHLHARAYSDPDLATRLTAVHPTELDQSSLWGEQKV